ncbi:hypothetical protein [endosymbiont of unidentified scaly snail isolate Monju]|uniref:hypothetical protein n=1 Tax=endosymbiont of unidentified scaly snail isolate Monju TaxID=1248727 RepID=UPI0003892593|nr:hypothetical protein [endosymbiont of unidentified scaly snail isolate Monju]BAN69835.1 hypothetical protein EBS_1973 [endosymbiont of unidentified scaly snail isolate Monju]
MKLPRLLFPLLLATTPLAQAQMVEFPLELIEYIDDVKVVTFVPPSALASAPTWDPMHQAVPFSLQQALDRVRTRLGNGDYQLTAIELKPIAGHRGHWHYLVRLRAPDGRPRYFSVLLDGRLLPATREPESYK